jgi:hypothetical protein
MSLFAIHRTCAAAVAEGFGDCRQRDRDDQKSQGLGSTSEPRHSVKARRCVVNCRGTVCRGTVRRVQLTRAARICTRPRRRPAELVSGLGIARTGLERTQVKMATATFQAWHLRPNPKRAPPSPKRVIVGVLSETGERASRLWTQAVKNAKGGPAAQGPMSLRARPTLRGPSGTARS